LAGGGGGYPKISHSFLESHGDHGSNIPNTVASVPSAHFCNYHHGHIYKVCAIVHDTSCRMDLQFKEWWLLVQTYTGHMYTISFDVHPVQACYLPFEQVQNIQL